MSPSRPRARALLVLAALLAMGLVAACSSSPDASGGGDASIDGGLPRLDAGDAGEDAAPRVAVRIPVVISPHGTFVELTLDDAGPAYFSLDTASWFSSLDPKAAKAAGLSAGEHVIRAGGGSATFNAGPKSFVALDANSATVSFPELPPGTTVVGTAGNNIWAGYRMGFDPAGGTLWLTPDELPTTPRPAGLGAPLILHGEHVLNPAETLDNNGIFTFPCRLSASASNAACMFDTGAPPPPTVIGALAASADYLSTKKVPSAAVDFTGKSLGGSYRLTAGLWGDDLPITQDQPVVAFDHFDVLEQEGAYFQRNIVGLLGLSNAFFSELDMTGGTLTLIPYVAPRSTERSYFLGYGVMAVASVTNGVSIAVLEGSDAQAKGVLDTDIWTGVDGAQDFSPVGVLLDAPGKTRTFSFLRAGQPIDVVIAAEDLLAP